MIEDASADTVLREGDALAACRPPRRAPQRRSEKAKRSRGPGTVERAGWRASTFALPTRQSMARRWPSWPTTRSARRFLRKITRGATGTTIPILPNTQLYRGDILTIVGRTQDTTAASKLLGVADRPTDVADVAFIGAERSPSARYSAGWS